MLCTLCADINLEALTEHGGYKHHASFKALNDSASRGCPSCMLIRAGRNGESEILKETWLGSTEDSQITMHVSHQGFLEVAQVERVEANRKPYLQSILRICLKPEQPCETFGNVAKEQAQANFHASIKSRFRKRVDFPVAVSDTYITAKNWLEHCMKYHSDCRAEATALNSLPTRVIDVGPQDGSEAPLLIVSNGKVGHWVTLSHCWGLVDPLKTTLKTLLEHQNSLPFSTLPPLFRDAVSITRRLGFRYLWIDSLCIIQDSQIDWQSESAQMGYIYKHAVVTIASETASSSAESIINKSQPPTTNPVELSCCRKDTECSMILYRARFDIKGRLSSRAWALQEDVLSPRILRWTQKQLTWHCRTVTCSEHDPTGAFNIDSKGRSIKSALYQSSDLRLICLPNSAFQQRKIQRETQLLAGTSSQELDPLALWDTISRDFASRSLTYDVDRLPAISGVAEEIARQTGYTYKSGLWAEKIWTELLWRVEGAASKPAEYIAPSWSWASLTINQGNSQLSRISQRQQREIMVNIAEVSRIDVIQGGIDEYGRVLGGELVLRGPCLRASTVKNLCGRYDCYLDLESESTKAVPALCVQLLSFPTKKWFSAINGQYFNGEVNGLILTLAHDKDGCYSRIGIIRIPAGLQGDGWAMEEVTVV